MYITIKTDNPEAELGLYDSSTQLAYDQWPAHRQLAETIHIRLENLLRENNAQLKDVTGIVVFRGPGSFTGLRIGVAVANALAYSLKIAVVGTDGCDWITDGLAKLQNGNDDQVVLPEYGAEARTTTQKK